MPEYTLQDCIVTVPEVFHDRTMNLFTLSHTNANEFTFVISRATAHVGEDVISMSKRLVEELKTSMNEFSLIHSKEICLSGKNGSEIFYRFKSGQSTIFQMQRVVLVDDNGLGKKIICFIGTCPDAFNEYHNKVFNSITDSIRFDSNTNLSNNLRKQIPSDCTSLFFTFDRDSRELSVFSGIPDLYRGVNLTRAKHGDYLFFDKDGHSLMLAPVNSGDDSERYGLWEIDGEQRTNLVDSLLLAKSVRGIPGIETINDVESYIVKRMNQE